METNTLPRLDADTAAQVAQWRSLDYVRWQSSLYLAEGSEYKAAQIFASRWPRSVSVDLVQKAATAAGSTTDATWAGPLSPIRPLLDGFLSLLRPRTLIGRIPSLRQVPFNVSVPQQTAGGTYGWVGQGAPTPVTKGDFATVTLGIAKAGGIIVLTDDLIKLSAPSAEAVARDEMIRGIAQFLDTQFVDPAVAAVANVSPASITNGTTPIVSAGTSQANAATDFQAITTQFVAANPDVENMVILTKPANAVALSRALNQPTLGLTGGTVFGIPVITSGSVGDRLIALDASQILFADDGGLLIDVSTQATVQLDSAPDDPTTASTVMVSLYQRNLAGLRVTRWINWKRASTSAVKYVSGAAYV